MSELVGRDADLAQVVTLLTAAEQGRGSLALVTGEAGIGKTALVEHAAELAASRGFRVATGACWPDGAPPYWPWSDVLRGLAPAAFAPTAGGADTEAVRFALYEGVVESLRAAASDAPLLALFEDLHWADRSCLSLLAFAVRTLRAAPIAFVATYRDDEVTPDHPVTSLLGDVARASAVVTLAGLAPEGVRALIAAATGTQPDPAMAAAVHRRTGGNPLFVGETVRLLGAEGRLDTSRSAWDLAVPTAALDVISRRLARLSQPAHDALIAAAVIGPTFDLDLLAAMTGVEAVALLDLLDEAAAAKLVQAGDGPDRWTFAHALVAEALQAATPARQRAALHAAAASTLRTLRGEDDHLSEIATHLRLALPLGDARAAFEFASRAATRAAAQLAYDEAVPHLRTALDLIARVGPAPGRRVALLLDLGTALLHSADATGAGESFEAAARLARDDGDADGVARAALGFGAGLGGFEIRVFDQRQIGVLEEALAIVPEGDSGLRSRLLARLAVALSFVADHSRRVDLADEAVQMARRVGDVEALASALAAHCDAIAGPAFVEARIAEATEIVELARSIGRRELELLGRRLLVVARFEQGDRVGLQEEVDGYATLADAIGLPLYTWYAELWRGALALVDGRFEDALAANARVEAVGHAGYSRNAQILAWVQRFVIARDQGRLDEIMPEVVASMTTDPELLGNPGSQATMACLRAIAGEHDAAEPALDAIASGLLDRMPVDSEWLPAVCSIAEAAWLCRHVDAARVLYDAMAPYADLWGIEGIGTGTHGAVHRHLGLLAATVGDLDPARDHLAAALDAHRRFGAPVLTARVEADLAELGSSPVASSKEPAFRRDGDGWSLSFAGTTCHLRDAKGLHDIATLLAAQGREVHVADLMGIADATGAAGADVDLDERARAAYRDRIVELRAELDEAEAAHDRGRADQARAELEFLTAELSGALGLGGRARRSGDPGERARKAVTNRIANSISRIERAHPELGHHLRRSIRTGTFCAYEPEQSVTWAL